jgi:YgiT-type zinc finger domain-containing protein
MNCFVNAEKSFTTSVTDLGHCLIIVRNVPCFKCSQCNEILYTGDVVEKLEHIIESAQRLTQEISVIDYKTVA